MAALTNRSIPFCKVDCSGNELKYIEDVIRSGWLTTAGKCQEFERAFAQTVGGKFACAVNSATAALHLAAEAVGIGPGDKVLVPTLTFTASAEIIRYLGADPILIDVEYGSALVTPEILTQALKRHPEAKALILVHFGGQAADMDALRPLCRLNGLKLIEDAAHAFPARWKGRLIGSFGDATCFSFYANKTITTGEGGMLVTDDEAVYRRVKTMRLHGINRDIWDRFTARKTTWEYDVVAPGYKYNMPDINAAIGLAQLERADEFRRGRQRCAESYRNRLAQVETIDLPVCHVSPDDHAWHLFWVVLNDRCRIARNDLIDAMNTAGIGLSVHYKPLHRMTYYRERYKLSPFDYPQAERHWRGAVSLPIYPGLSDDDLDYVCQTLIRLTTA